jgi:hypothetical protein
MYKEIRVTELTEDKLRTLTEKTVIVSESGQVVGMFVPPPGNAIDPYDPFLTKEEVQRRLLEPARPWAEVKARLLKL